MTDYFSEFLLSPAEKAAFGSLATDTSTETPIKLHVAWLAITLAVGFLSWKLSQQLTKNKLESGAS